MVQQSPHISPPVYGWWGQIRIEEDTMILYDQTEAQVSSKQFDIDWSQVSLNFRCEHLWNVVENWKGQHASQMS